jgi:hypothetical protein
MNSGGNPGPLVLDVQLDQLAARSRGEHDPAASVLERVVNEVSESLLEPDRVGIEHEPVRRHGLEGLPAPAGLPGEALGDHVEHGRRRDPLQSDREPAGVGACDQKQVLGQVKGLVARLERLGHHERCRLGPERGSARETSTVCERRLWSSEESSALSTRA